MTAPPPIARTSHFTAAVSEVESLSPRMRRIRLFSPDFADRTWPLACDVAIVLTADGREVRRRYTVRAADTDGIVLDAVLHGHGPGSTWAERVAPGDEVSFHGPRGEVPLPTEAGRLLALTDEAGLPAVAAVAERTERPMTVCAEVSGPDEIYPLPENVQPYWIPRGATAPGGTSLLAAALDTVSAPSEAGFAYVLGESRAIVTLRDLLVERGVHRTQIYAKGYWNLNSRNTR